MGASGILVLVTGGTIDKTYFDNLSEYKYSESVISGILKVARVNHLYRLNQVMLKDSLDIDYNDRNKIARSIEAAPESRIVITHGTDTMAETAMDLAARDLGKTIVLAGAFMPARFSTSDGAFNVGMAFAAAQVAPAGVYIAMNGSIFPAGHVVKDRAGGTFRRVEPVELMEADYTDATAH